MLDAVRRSAVLVVAVALALGAMGRGARAAEVPIATADEIRAEIEKTPCKNKERLEAVQALFRRMGASDEEISVAHFKKVDNVVVTVKGREEGFVVVGAHYDKTPNGCGAIDNWTGIVILANLYRTIRATSPRKTIVFVAFGKEEDGLVGSNEMASAIPKEERSRYCAMVNLDSFGLSVPQVLTSASTPKLSSFVETVARENKVPTASASLSDADADSRSFKFRGIPAVTLHGLTDEWRQILHSPRDKVSKVGLDSVYLGYRFILVVIGRLDECDCAAFQEK
jgi:hypothetical protein